MLNTMYPVTIEDAEEAVRRWGKSWEPKKLLGKRVRLLCSYQSSTGMRSTAVYSPITAVNITLIPVALRLHLNNPGEFLRGKFLYLEKSPGTSLVAVWRDMTDRDWVTNQPLLKKTYLERFEFF